MFNVVGFIKLLIMFFFLFFEGCVIKFIEAQIIKS